MERNRVYEQYINNLKNEDGIIFQKINSNIDPLMWSVSININKNVFNKSRDEIINKLKDENIETRPGFVSSSFISFYKTYALLKLTSY